MNESLTQTTQTFQPHLILLGHSASVSEKTLETLKGILPNSKIAQWFVDWFIEPHLPTLRAKQPYLDAFFATSSPSYYAPLIGGENSPSLYYLPNTVDSSIETERSFAKGKHDYDIFFAGSDAPERVNILEEIRALAGIRCRFFGFSGQPTINGSAFMNTIAKSKIGLNLSRATEIPLYSSDRLAQLTGNGCLAITPNTPQMTTLFAENEVAYYDNTEELLASIQHYSKDVAAWRKIAEAGWKRAHTSYNERRVAKFIVEATMGDDFSEPYEWLFTTVAKGTTT